MPVVRTGVYPHMPIAVTANSLQHWPSPSNRRPVSHTVRDGRATLSHRANTVERVIDFSIFDLGGLPPGQRSPKGEMTYYPPRSTILQNFSTIAKRSTRYALPKFFTFWPLGGLTPGPKFTKRGDDLVDSEIYHRAKFHRSTPTHARGICYQNFADKQTVNYISPACLSACGDNQHAYRHVGIINMHTYIPP